MGDKDLSPPSPMPTRIPGSVFRDEALQEQREADNLVPDMSPDVIIRNAAWATHPAPMTSKSHGNTRSSGHALTASSTADEGRMPSPLELVWLFCDYVVLRALRSAAESLFIRVAMMMGSNNTGGKDSEEREDSPDRRFKVEPESHRRRVLKIQRRFSKASSMFEVSHRFLNRLPFWVLSSLVHVFDLLQYLTELWDPDPREESNVAVAPNAKRDKVRIRCNARFDLPR